MKMTVAQSQLQERLAELLGGGGGDNQNVY